MLIEIAETHPAQYGRKMAHVLAAGGDKFEVYPELFAGLKIGGTYEVEVAERDYQGRTIRKITKVQPALARAHQGRAAHSVVASGEPGFVGVVLAGLIAAGHVGYDKKQLYEATNTLRVLWGATFGGRRNGDG